MAQAYIDREAAKDELCDRCMNVAMCTRSDNDCPIKRGLNAISAADVVDREQYDKVLTAAKAMHEWIFLNTADEQEVYDDCGLSDEMNALLGSMGGFEIRGKENDDA